MSGGKFLAVSYEYNAEIYRQKKTAIPGKNLGTKIVRKEGGSFQLYKVENRFLMVMGSISIIYQKEREDADPKWRKVPKTGTFVQKVLNDFVLGSDLMPLT